MALLGAIFTSVFAQSSPTDEFAITVQVNYIDLTLTDMTGGAYSFWEIDTINLSTTKTMTEGEGIHLINTGNTTIFVSASVTDHPDGWSYPGYVHWVAEAFPDSFGEFRLRATFSGSPTFDPGASLWTILDEIPVEFIAGLPESSSRYIWLEFTSPMGSTDRLFHVLDVTFTGYEP